MSASSNWNKRHPKEVQLARERYNAKVKAGIPIDPRKPSELTVLRRENAELREALRPLARLAYHRELEALTEDTVLFELDAGGPVNVVTMGDVRHAGRVMAAGMERIDRRSA